jgi:Ca-activated chloride channel homolog
VSFQAPLLLGSLLLVPLALAAYVAAQRRRRRFALRYPAVDVLAAVAGRSWGRHLPALLALLALAALLVALARPQHTVAAERREATVVLVTDTSGSMLATDIRPSRLSAIKAAARTFVRDVPDEFRVGLVRFGTTAEQLVEPTTDHPRVLAAVTALKVKGTTAMGDGLARGLDAARIPVVDDFGDSRRLPAAMVLLSDGANQRGEDPLAVARRAKRLGVRIYTVALGTQNGTLEVDGRREPVPPDPRTLREIARTTGGQFFAAPDRGQLEAVYANLATRLAHRREQRELTSSFAGGALALLLAGVGIGLLRGGRLP